MTSKELIDILKCFSEETIVEVSTPKGNVKPNWFDISENKIVLSEQYEMTLDDCYKSYMK